MSDAAVEHYERKFHEDVRGAFVHMAREVGELARAIEQEQRELTVIEVTEIDALMDFRGLRSRFDLAEKVTEPYAKKLEKLAGA